MDDVVPGAPTKLAQLAEQWWSVASKEDTVLDASCLKLAHDFLDPGNAVHVESACGLAQQYELRAHAVSQVVEEVASLGCMQDRMERRDVYQRIVSATSVQHPLIVVRFLHEAEFEMYDESPHKLSCLDFFKSTTLHKILEPLALTLPASCDMALQPISRLGNRLSGLTAKETGPANCSRCRLSGLRW